MRPLAFPFLFLLLLTACDKPQSSNVSSPPGDVKSSAETRPSSIPPAATTSATSAAALREAMGALKTHGADVLQLASELRATLDEEEKTRAVSPREAGVFRSKIKPDATLKELIAVQRNLSHLKPSKRIESALHDLKIASDTYVAQAPRLTRVAADAELKMAHADWLSRAPAEVLKSHADVVIEIRNAIVSSELTHREMEELSQNLERSAKFLRDSAALKDDKNPTDVSKYLKARYRPMLSPIRGFVSKEEVDAFILETREPFWKELQTKYEGLRQAILKNLAPEEIQTARKEFVTLVDAFEETYRTQAKFPVTPSRLAYFADCWSKAHIPASAAQYSDFRKMEDFVREFAESDPVLSKIASDMAVRSRAQREAEKAAIRHPEPPPGFFEKVTDAATAQSAIKELESLPLPETTKARTRSLLTGISKLYEDPRARAELVHGTTNLPEEVKFLNEPPAAAAKERALRSMIAKNIETPQLLQGPLASKPLSEAIDDLEKELITQHEWEKVSALQNVRIDYIRPNDRFALTVQRSETFILVQGQRSERANDFPMAVSSYRQVLRIGKNPVMIDFATARLKEISEAHPEAMTAPAPATPTRTSK